MTDSSTWFYRIPTLAVLAVSDLSAASDWYRSVLGFTVVLSASTSGQTPGFVHLRRARYQDLLLVPPFEDFVTSSGERGGGVRLVFRTEEDVEDLAASVKKGGGQIVEVPADKPWNAREFTVQDPDGYRITFSNLSWVSGIA